MSDALISIIIPVYNTEKYLRRCVDSVIDQSYKNLEIILVNDGSTDTSPEICKEFASQDDRIKVVHQENGGLSAARNTGVKHATGEYISFIDSDDYVVTDYISNLYFLIKEHNADISITDHLLEYDETGNQEARVQYNDQIHVWNRHEAMEAYLYQRYFITVVWGRLYHHKILKGIEFPPQMYHEELGVLHKFIDKAEIVIYQATPDYLYIQRKTSGMHSDPTRRTKDTIKLAEDMRIFIEERYPSLTQAVVSKCFSSYILRLMEIPLKNIYNDEYNDLRAGIKKYRWQVLTNPKARYKNRGCALLSYFGIWVLKIALDFLDN